MTFLPVNRSGKVLVAKHAPTPWVLILFLAALQVESHAQEPSPSIQGMVRDTSGTSLEGVAVTIGQRQTVTDAGGRFRMGNLSSGRYWVSLRLVGYAPLRSQLTVQGTGVTHVTYHLVRVLPRLPTIVVEASRTGIFGTVRDPEHRPIAEAQVHLFGTRRSSVSTDSGGRFSFPAAEHGLFVVRVARAGYAERLVTVELERGKGQELRIRLTPGIDRESRMVYAAFEDLQTRLAFGLRREFVAARDLVRYQGFGLCDIARIKAELGSGSGATTTLIVNGVTVYRNFPVTSLCLWRADEVELVEVGRDFCRDVTGSIALLLGGWCSGRVRTVPRSLSGTPGRLRTQPGGSSYVVIWERR